MLTVIKIIVIATATVIIVVVVVVVVAVVVLISHPGFKATAQALLALQRPLQAPRQGLEVVSPSYLDSGIVYFIYKYNIYVHTKYIYIYIDIMSPRALNLQLPTYGHGRALCLRPSQSQRLHVFSEAQGPTTAVQQVYHSACVDLH